MHPALQTAYSIGTWYAKQAFLKVAEAALGDPNYWTGGSDAQAQQPPPPQNAEEAIQLLPGGTFQGLNMRIGPDGQRSTVVKVSPEAIQDPSVVNSIFEAEPGAKVEVAAPEQAMPGTQIPLPGAAAGPAEGAEGAPPAEAAPPPPLG